MLPTTKVKVLSPRGEKRPSASRVNLAPRINSLSGKAIFLVSNRRPNAEALMDAIAEALSRNYAPSRVTRVRKARSGMPLDDETLKRVETEYDAVVSGLCS